MGRLLLAIGVSAALLAPADAVAQSPLPYTSLAPYVVDVVARIPRSGTEAFVEPPAADIAAFETCSTALLAGDIATAGPCLDALGYDLRSLDDAAFSRRYLIAEERVAGLRGLGTFIVDVGCHRDVVFAAPHPIFDTNTATESRRLFQELGARALVIAGTHRCANAAASPCDGTSTACGDGVYHVSDTAHYTQNFMQAFHAALLAMDPVPLAFSIHGNAAEPVDVELSDGTSRARPWNAPVIMVRDELLRRGVSAGSCNWPADGALGLSLCGGTNVQGRLLNGSPDPCLTSARDAAGRFIHVEQRRVVRDDPTLLIAALDDTVPADGMLLLARKAAGGVLLEWTGGLPPYRVVRGSDARFRTARVDTAAPAATLTDAAPPPGLVFYDVR